MSIFTSLFGAKAQELDQVEILSPKEFKSQITKKIIQLVDVRTPREFNGGHIKGAKNIDMFQQANFELQFGKLAKDQPVYLYCRSGMRSQKAARRLVKLGFEQIYDLQGGYINWR